VRHYTRSVIGRFCAAVAIGVATFLTPDSAQALPTLDPTWLEGTIGDAKVRIYLESPFTPDVDTVYGVYYYERYGEPIVLKGLPAADDYIALGECDECEKPDSVNIMRLKIGAPNALVVEGTWTSADGTRSLPVRLRRVEEFVKQNVARTLRKFADRRWPIEFMYPAEWLVIVTPQRLVVRPPDPEDMLWRNELECKQGHGVPDAPVREDESVEIDDIFLRTSSGWRIDSGFGINEATVRRYATGTVISGDVAYKHGALWPLPGIFEEARHLVLSGNTWVTCSDRLEGALNLRPARSR